MPTGESWSVEKTGSKQHVNYQSNTAPKQTSGTQVKFQLSGQLAQRLPKAQEGRIEKTDTHRHTGQQRLSQPFSSHAMFRYTSP